jgi:hypothetical protein
MLIFNHQLLHAPGAGNATRMPLPFKVKMVHVKVYADLSMRERLVTSFLVPFFFWSSCATFSLDAFVPMWPNIFKRLVECKAFIGIEKNNN